MSLLNNSETDISESATRETRYEKESTNGMDCHLSCLMDNRGFVLAYIQDLLFSKLEIPFSFRTIFCPTLYSLLLNNVH